MTDQPYDPTVPVRDCPVPRAARSTGAVHLVGIGGMHMSAIAQILLRNGVRVQGSDQSRSAMTEQLRALGAGVHYGHTAEHLGDVDLVVTTAAAKPDNPELVEARRRGIPVISRATMVARLMAGKTGVCVAGTHGKTTTSSMIAWLLRQAGRDPSFLLGGESIDLGTNAWAGEGDEIVVEADEYARAFLEYSARVAVVTNVEADHLEYYGSVEAYEDAFRQFMARVRPDGVIVACADSPALVALGSDAYPARRAWYRVRAVDPAATWSEDRLHAYAGEASADGDADVSPSCWALNFGVGDRGGSDLAVFRHGRYHGRFSLAIPGAHMAQNAVGAIEAGFQLGLEAETMRAALATFRGARRRFEEVGITRGITVIDDFAHHPTEIRANITAARERYPGRRIIVVFQPHTYSRTSYLLDEFSTCFKDAGQLFILETFASRETPSDGISAQQLSEAVKSPACEYLRTAEDAAGRLQTELRSGDVLVTMGAGDVDQVGRLVLEGLRSP